MTAPLCDPCREAWLAWLDYRAPATVKLAQSGGSSARLVRMANDARAADRRELIKFQQGLIADLCAAGNHASAS